MQEFKNIDDILDFAIKGEEQAHQFYMDLAGKMESPAKRELFEGFAREELKHKENLLGIKKGQTLKPSGEKVQDLKIADYVVDVEPKPDMDYQDVLILVMKKEKAAYKLYRDLADLADRQDLRDTFLALAEQEANHKLRFEIEYDDLMD